MYSVNSYYGNATFAVPSTYLFDMSPIEINNQSWESINEDMKVIENSPWRAEDASAANSFASSYDEDDLSVLRCTAIRTISTNREASDVSKYQMAFKKGETYEVETGFKVWLTGSDAQVSSFKDGGSFEI